MKSCLLGAVYAFVIAIISQSANSVGISGQGTWETTLQGRDLDGNLATFEAYYDTVLDITWLRDANYAVTSGDDVDGRMIWVEANAWVSNLSFYDPIRNVTYDNWRLPTLGPVNGISFNTAYYSLDGTTDYGYASTTTDGSDGGWRDSSGNPVSELGHMFYVTLANLGYCSIDSPPICSPPGQPGYGLTNTGPFTNIAISTYWSDMELNASEAWEFNFYWGLQINVPKWNDMFIWAVAEGDIGAVPIPPAVWLFGSGLIGLVGVARLQQ